MFCGFVDVWFAFRRLFGGVFGVSVREVHFGADDAHFVGDSCFSDACDVFLSVLFCAEVSHVCHPAWWDETCVGGKFSEERFAAVSHLFCFHFVRSGVSSGEDADAIAPCFVACAGIVFVTRCRVGTCFVRFGLLLGLVLVCGVRFCGSGFGGLLLCRSGSGDVVHQVLDGLTLSDGDDAFSRHVLSEVGGVRRFWVLCLQCENRQTEESGQKMFHEGESEWGVSVTFGEERAVPTDTEGLWHSTV